MSIEGRRNAPPKAGPLIEALRGLGYSTASALADVIDNSITAGADNVDVTFWWDGLHSRVGVLDNGSGMSEPELDRAMRLGEVSPLDGRPPHDLGRFGLGMKTASFSQCRRLTVASMQSRVLSCLRWDLDVLTRSDDGWYLLDGPAPGSEQWLDTLQGRETGTLVLWEVLDRMVMPGMTEQGFLDLVDRVERHLAMVFHRFLVGPRPRFRLTINGRRVEPWDPFLLSNPATWSSPLESIDTASGRVEARAHVLPHKDRLDAGEYETAAGPDGWTAQQGFYVYRNERLLVGGTWLGLGQGRAWTKEEAHRLARIRLDIESVADADWRIDIRKSVARPPHHVKSRLTRLAEDARERARRVFATRGRSGPIGTERQIEQTWRTEDTAGGVRYRLDENHPAISTVLSGAGELAPQVRAMLRVIEETVPVQRIWLDTAEGKETPRAAFAGESTREVVGVLEIVFRSLVEKQGMSPTQARDKLLHTEPFDEHAEAVNALADEYQDMRGSEAG